MTEQKNKRKGHLLLAGLAIVAAGGIGVSYLTSSAHIKSKIIESVKQSTGRDMTIGSFEWHLFPHASIELKNVQLSGINEANPEMLSASDIFIKPEIIPLLSHRVVLDDITITNPKITLSRYGDGQADWQFQQGQTSESSAPSKWQIIPENLSITNASIAYNDQLEKRSGQINFPKISLLHADTDHSDILIEGTGQTSNGPQAQLKVTGTTGRLWPLDGHIPIHINTVLSHDDKILGHALIDGGIEAHSGQQVTNLHIDGNIPELDSLNAFSPQMHIPQGHDISLQTDLHTSGQTYELHSLHFKTGSVDLSQIAPHSLVNHLSVDADTATSPLLVDLDGALQGQHITMTGSAGTLGMLSQGGLKNDVPIDLKLAQDAKSAFIKGTIGQEVSQLSISGEVSSLPVNNIVLNDIHLDTVLQTNKTQELYTHHAMSDILSLVKVNNLNLTTGSADLSKVLGEHSSLRYLSIKAANGSDPILLNLDAILNGQNATATGSAGTLDMFTSGGLKKDIPIDLKLTQDTKAAFIKGTIGQTLSKLSVSGDVNRFPVSNLILNDIHLDTVLETYKTQELLTHHTAGDILNLVKVRNLNLTTGKTDLSKLLGERSFIRRLSIKAVNENDPILLNVNGALNGQNAIAKGTAGTIAMFTSGTLKNDVPVKITLEEGKSVATLNGKVGPQNAKFNIVGDLTRLPLNADISFAGIHANADIYTDKMQALKTHHTVADIARYVSAEGKVSANQLFAYGGSWTKVASPISMHDGKIALDPIYLYGSGYEQHVTVHYNAALKNPEAVITMKPLFVPLPVVAKVMKLTWSMQGTAEVVGKITTSGKTSAELQKHADGHIGVSIANGKLGKDFLRRLLGNNFSFLATSVPFSCAGLHMKLEDNKAAIDTIGVRSMIAQIYGHGKINLNNQTIAMLVTPAILIGSNRNYQGTMMVDGDVNSPDVHPASGSDISKVNSNKVTSSRASGWAAFPEIVGNAKLETKSEQEFCPALFAATRENIAGPVADPANSDSKNALVDGLAEKAGADQKTMKKVNKGMNILKGFLGGSNKDSGNSSSGDSSGGLPFGL